MPTRRTKIKRHGHKRLSPELIAAWHSCDYGALHVACGLQVWERSPLPREICAYGVDAINGVGRESLYWQRLLLEAAGWPSDCRVAYEANLKEAEHQRDRCIELLRHPERGGIGTGCDPISRRRKLEEAEEWVAYRQQLLAELEAETTT